MPDTLTVFSPVQGAVVPLEQVPDPVFSEHMLGDGLAIDPAGDTIYAPFDGKIIDFNKASHALVLGSGGAEVLLHVGLETVNLKGEGFTPLAKTGDSIKKGQPLLKFNPHILAQKVPCPFVILVVTTPAETQVPHKAEGVVKTGDFLFDVSLGVAQSTSPAEEHFTQSAPIRVINPNGLHARPAGVLAQLALQYPHSVELVKGTAVANAKSVVAVMGLALEYGNEVIVRAGGPEAEAKTFLAKMEKGFAEAFGEKGAAITPKKPTEKSCALAACSGLAYGQAFVYRSADITFEETASNPSAETKRLEETLQTVLAETQAKMAAEANEENKTILSAHASMLQDPDLAQTARAAVQQGKSAAYGLNQAMRKSIEVLQKTGNAFLMERIADLEDLRRTLLLRLGGKQAKSMDLPKGCICIAQELLPSEVGALAGKAAGVLLAQGSPTAHAGIMLRNMGIPTLVRAGQEVLSIANGTPICLDADRVHFIVNPTPKQLAEFTARAEQHRQEEKSQTLQALQPAATQDGLRILVEGNVSNEQEAALAIHNGADGLGLVRTEFLFHGRTQAPSQQEQQQAYQAVLNAAQGKPVTLRTLDAGGDKPLAFVHIPPEQNPIVGIRGIRAFEQNESFFRTQLRAMLSTRHTGNLRIMLPMVAFADEIDFFKNLIAQEQASLGTSVPVQVGIMVEVPSAALTSGQMAARADFFSIGTNDLTQYTLAIDRGHKELSGRADHLHPAVLKLIDLTCRGARQHHKPVAVCGAMAGDLAAVPFLIGLGVTELAVGGKAVAQVKALVRKLDAKQCAQAAQKAIELADAQQVRALARETFGV